MNERIRELADRACEYADYDPGYMPDEFLMKFVELINEELSKDADEWYDKQKFAKSIVLECIDVISPYAIRMENFDGGHPITDLKKHFGVE